MSLYVLCLNNKNFTDVNKTNSELYLSIVFNVCHNVGKNLFYTKVALKHFLTDKNAFNETEIDRKSFY